jgi:hypothetical protein
MSAPVGILFLIALLLLPVNAPMNAAEDDRAWASDGCMAGKPFREVGQDEVTTMAELCDSREREE